MRTLLPVAALAVTGLALAATHGVRSATPANGLHPHVHGGDCAHLDVHLHPAGCEPLAPLAITGVESSREGSRITLDLALEAQLPTRDAQIELRLPDGGVVVGESRQLAGSLEPTEAFETRFSVEALEGEGLRLELRATATVLDPTGLAGPEPVITTRVLTVGDYQPELAGTLVESYGDPLEILARSVDTPALMIGGEEDAR